MQKPKLEPAMTILLVSVLLLQLQLIHSDAQNITSNVQLATKNNITSNTSNAQLQNNKTERVLTSQQQQPQLNNTIAISQIIATGNMTVGVEKTRSRKITPTSRDPKELLQMPLNSNATTVVYNKTVQQVDEQQQKEKLQQKDNVAPNTTNIMETALNTTTTTIASNAAITQHAANIDDNKTTAATKAVAGIASPTNATATAAGPNINNKNTTNTTAITTTLSTTKATQTTASTTTAPKATPTTTPTTTTTTITTTTTTLKPKPKKPLITYGVVDFPDLDGDILKQPIANSYTSSKLPAVDFDALHEVPHVQASLEHPVSAYRRNTDYIVPILALMFAAPLLMGILITIYRRFRDFWSTRHYSRMDFLVDGMYND